MGSRIAWRSQISASGGGACELEFPGEGEVAAIHGGRLEGVNWVPMWSQKRVLFFGDPAKASPVYPFLEGLSRNNNKVGFLDSLEDVSPDDIRKAKPNVVFLPTPDDKSVWATNLRKNVLEAVGETPEAVAYYDTSWLSRWPLAYCYSEEERAYKHKLMWHYKSQMNRTDFAQATLDMNRALALEMGQGRGVWGVEIFGLMHLGGSYLSRQAGLADQYLIGGRPKGDNTRALHLPKNHLLLVAGVHYDDESIPCGTLARSWKANGPVVNLMMVSGAGAVIPDIEALGVNDSEKYRLRDERRYSELTAANKFSGIETISLCHSLQDVASDGLNFYDRRRQTGKAEITKPEYNLMRDTIHDLIRRHNKVDGVWVALPYSNDAHPDHQVVHHTVSDIISHSGGLCDEMWGLQYPSPWAGTGNLFYYMDGRELEGRRKWAQEADIKPQLVEAVELREHANAIAAGEMLVGWGEAPRQPKQYAVRILLKPVKEALKELDD